MATNFSPCKGSYVSNQFASNERFGMNGFQPAERYRAIMALLLFLSGVYVLNQFPSIVMLGMKGFHVSASGVIQGHHGPLVFVQHELFIFYQTALFYVLASFSFGSF